MSHIADVSVAAEGEKKRYLTVAEARCASFSPFVVNVDGGIAVLFCTA